MNFTTAQEQAAGHRNEWLMVAAGAGSGKTAVLAERCARLVADGPNPCGVTELLVLTFTREAAAEMRGRIAAALRNKAAAGMVAGGVPSANAKAMRRLNREAALVDQAHIGTFDSFCDWLARTYFSECGVDPGFAVVDELEAKLLFADAVRDTVRQWLAQTGEPGECFRNIFDYYADGSMERIRRLIEPIVRLWQTMPLGEAPAWIATAGGAASLADFAGTYQRQLEQLAQDLDAALDNAIFDADSKQNMLANLGQARDALHQAAGILRKRGIDGWDAMAAALPAKAFTQAVRLSAKASDAPTAETFKKNIYETRKKDYQFLRKQLAGHTAQTLRADQQTAGRMIGVLLDFSRACQSAYGQAKQAANQLDFADLEQRAVEALEKDAGSLARRVRRRFRHILVDEYQDINPLQQRLVELLYGPVAGGVPPADALVNRPDSQRSLFGVGDIHQSIYAFRGSEPALMRRQIGVLEKNQPAGVVNMAENFRSLPPLIEAFNVLFTRLFQSSGPLLRAGRAATTDAAALPGAPVELHVLVKDEPNGDATSFSESQADSEATGHDADNDDDGEAENPLAELDANQRQAELIADLITTLRRERRCLTARDGSRRPVEFSDIAILMRSPGPRAAPFLRVLANRGIPAVAELRTGFFESPEVLETLDLLHALDNPAQDIALASVLLGPFGQFSHDELMRIRLAYPDRRRIAFHQAVTRFATERQSDSAAGVLVQKTRALLERLRQWRHVMHTLGVAEGLNQIYEASGILLRVLSETDGRQRLANLRLLHRRAVEFTGFGAQSLARFTEFIRELQDTREDWGEAAPAGVHAVRLMSIHAAKGLEFPVVFVAGLGNRFNLRELQGNLLINRQGLGLKVYDPRARVFRATAGYQMIREKQRQRLLEEEARLLYVAMTRACDHLVLVGHAARREWEAWAAYGQTAAPEERDLVEPPAAQHGEAEDSAADKLAARCALDWLGPIFSLYRGPDSGGAPALGLIRHAWEAGGTATRPVAGDIPIPNANVPQRADDAGLIQPANATISDAELALLLERIGKPYPFEAQTRLPAVTTVTELKMEAANLDAETPAAVLDIVEQASGMPSPMRRRDKLEAGPAAPASLPDVAPEEGVTRGLAVHTVLQRLDLTAILNEADILKQIAGFVSAGALTAAEAQLVDVAGIAWLFTTPIGQRLIAAARMMKMPGQTAKSLLRREVTFLWSPPSEMGMALGDHSAGNPLQTSTDPADRPLVRGVIDALLIEESGVHVVDYKTDVPALIADRLPMYRRQVTYYTRAAAAILRRPITGGTLVFLSARRCEVV